MAVRAVDELDGVGKPVNELPIPRRSHRGSQDLRRERDCRHGQRLGRHGGDRGKQDSLAAGRIEKQELGRRQHQRQPVEAERDRQRRVVERHCAAGVGVERKDRQNVVALSCRGLEIRVGSRDQISAVA